MICTGAPGREGSLSDPTVLLARLADHGIETFLDPVTLADFRVLRFVLQPGIVRHLSIEQAREMTIRFNRVTAHIHRTYRIEWGKLWLQRRDARNRRRKG